MRVATPAAASCGGGGGGYVRSSTPRGLFTTGGGLAAKATCASPGTPLSESALPFEFDPITAAAAQRCAMKHATERAAAEPAASSSPPLAQPVQRSPNASAKPAAAVAEVAPAVQNFRQEVAALILQAEALRQRKVKVERLKADLRQKADQTDRGLDAALQVRQGHAHRQWEEMRRVACQLWEADCTPKTEAQLSVRRELDATSKAKQEAGRRLVSAQERATAAEKEAEAAAERATAKVLLEKKVAEAEAKAVAAEEKLRTSEKQRDTAIAYLVEQQPLQKKVAAAEAKAEAKAAAALAKAVEAERVSKTLEQQRDTALAFLVDQDRLKAKLVEAEEMLRTSEEQRDTAIAYMVEQQPLQKKVAAAEAKAKAAEEKLRMSETQRDTALAYLVDKGAIAHLADKEAALQEAQAQGAEAQERRREGRQQQAREQLAAARDEEKLERQRREARERAAEVQEIATPSTQFVDCRIRRVAAAASSPLSGTGADRQRQPRHGPRPALVSMEPVALNSALALTYRQLKSL